MLSKPFFLTFAASSLAHMEMMSPPPLNSKFNKNANSALIDYSMTAPLKPDGSDFPCKGYQSVLGTDGGKSVATYKPGEKASITITGGANHNGGSCQISLSYDNAKTFTVIQSIVGNCPGQGESSYDFIVPLDAQKGGALLAWTWFNKVGNREMYMNCASVTIGDNSSSKLRRSGQLRRTGEKRAAAYSSRPPIFVANVGNGCATIEMADLMFPDPGPDTTENETDTKPPTGSCGPGTVSGNPRTGSGKPGADGGAPGSETGQDPDGESPKSDPPTSSPSGPPPGGVFFTDGPSSSPAPTPPQSKEPTNDAPSSASPTNDSQSPPPAPPSDGTFPPGTSCLPEGLWNCIDGQSFQRCASGLWSVPQPLNGVTCQKGTSNDLSVVAKTAVRDP